MLRVEPDRYDLRSRRISDAARMGEDDAVGSARLKSTRKQKQVADVHSRKSRIAARIDDFTLDVHAMVRRELRLSYGEQNKFIAVE